MNFKRAWQALIQKDPIPVKQTKTYHARREISTPILASTRADIKNGSDPHIDQLRAAAKQYSNSPIENTITELKRKHKLPYTVDHLRLVFSTILGGASNEGIEDTLALVDQFPKMKLEERIKHYTSWCREHKKNPTNHPEMQVHFFWHSTGILLRAHWVRTHYKKTKIIDVPEDATQDPYITHAEVSAIFGMNISIQWIEDNTPIKHYTDNARAVWPISIVSEIAYAFMEIADLHQKKIVKEQRENANRMN